MSNKNSYFIIFILLLFLLFSNFIISEEVIFIPEGEVDGIRIGSFYLSSEVITNQDYFYFMTQIDGYNKHYLWDPEALKMFDKFINNKEKKTYGPRTWEDNNPPEGQEFQPLLGISIYEARAYARSKGWMIPTKEMWKLAQKIKPDIGPYPWENSEENINGIRMARFYAPASTWENRFKSLKKELSNLKKTTPKISQVNLNALKIRKFENRLNTIEKSLKKVNKIEEIVKTTVENVINKKLEKLVKEVENIKKENKNKKIEKRIENLESKISILDKLKENIKEITNKSLKNIQEELNKKLKNIENNIDDYLKNKLSWNKKIKILENNLNSQKKYIFTIENSFNKKNQNFSKIVKEVREKNDNIFNKVKKLEENYNEIKKEQDELKNKQLSFINKQFDKIKEKIEKIEKNEERINKCENKIKDLCILCPSLGENLNYRDAINKIKEKQTIHEQKITELNNKFISQNKAIIDLRAKNFTLNTKFSNINTKIDGLNSSINTLKQFNENINIEIQNLKKQDAVLSKEDSSIKGLIGTIKKQNEKQDKDITKLYQKTAQLESKNKEIESDIEELKKQDNSQINKINNLEIEINNIKENLKQQEQTNEKFLDEIKNLKLKDIEYNKKNIAINETLEDLRKKDKEIIEDLRNTEKELKHNIQQVKTEVNLARKESYKEFEDRLEKISQKANNNYAKIIALEQQFNTQKINIDNNFNLFNTRLKKVEEKTYQLESDLRVGSAQVRANMIEIGEKIRQLFLKGIVIGGVPAKEPLVIPPKKKEKPKKEKPKKKEEKKKKPKKEKVIVKETKVIKKTIVKQIVLSKKDMALICNKLGKIYYDFSYPHLSLACFKLALNFYPHDVYSRRFLTKHWEELNCPKGMIYIPGGSAKLGNHGDPDFPYKEVKIKSFYIDKYEVTRKEFAKFINSGGYKNDKYWSKKGLKWRAWRKQPIGWKDPTPEEENLPVTNVNYYEAEAYAKWAGKRLPTPEEWEYAARGTDLRIYPWGNNPPHVGNFFYANYKQLEKEKDKYKKVAPVGTFIKDKSPFGVMDMAGNVSEWCDGYYKTPSTKKKYRVVKGGSFKNLWFRLHVYSAIGKKPEEKFDFIGFRCVKDIPIKDFR